MSSTKTPITVRTADDILKRKLQRLASIRGRSLSKEAELILIRYIESYEKTYGKIELD